MTIGNEINDLPIGFDEFNTRRVLEKTDYKKTHKGVRFTTKDIQKDVFLGRLSTGKPVLKLQDIFVTNNWRIDTIVLGFPNGPGLAVGVFVEQIFAVIENLGWRFTLKDCSWFVPH